MSVCFDSSKVSLNINCDEYVKKPVFVSEDEKQKESIVDMYNYYNLLFMQQNTSLFNMDSVISEKYLEKMGN